MSPSPLMPAGARTRRNTSRGAGARVTALPGWCYELEVLAWREKVIWLGSAPRMDRAGRGVG